jgi:hypothetical protein
MVVKYHPIDEFSLFYFGETGRKTPGQPKRENDASSAFSAIAFSINKL